MEDGDLSGRHRFTSAKIGCSKALKTAVRCKKTGAISLVDRSVVLVIEMRAVVCDAPARLRGPVIVGYGLRNPCLAKAGRSTVSWNGGVTRPTGVAFVRHRLGIAVDPTLSWLEKPSRRGYKSFSVISCFLDLMDLPGPTLGAFPRGPNTTGLINAGSPSALAKSDRFALVRSMGDMVASVIPRR